MNLSIFHLILFWKKFHSHLFLSKLNENNELQFISSCFSVKKNSHEERRTFWICFSYVPFKTGANHDLIKSFRFKIGKHVYFGHVIVVFDGLRWRFCWKNNNNRKKKTRQHRSKYLEGVSESTQFTFQIVSSFVSIP